MAFTEALLLGVFCFQHETLEKKRHYGYIN